MNISSMPARANRRWAYTAFGWVLVFLAWHVVWAVTGLDFPSTASHHGTARVLMQVFTVAVLLMVAVGITLPLALARAWGPRRLLLLTAWAGAALLGARGLAGVADDLVRATGLLSGGLTGLTTAQVSGSAHPSGWAQTAGYATDALFLTGGLTFAAAAVAYGRLTAP